MVFRTVEAVLQLIAITITQDGTLFEDITQLKNQYSKLLSPKSREILSISFLFVS